MITEKEFDDFIFKDLENNKDALTKIDRNDFSLANKIMILLNDLNASNKNLFILGMFILTVYEARIN